MASTRDARQAPKLPPAQPLPPDAMAALRKACAETTQAATARLLKISEGTVSNALKGRYIGNVDRLAERIRGELLHTTVACPILGRISARLCQDERAKPLHAANPLRVQLWRACQDCIHNPACKGPSNPLKGEA